MVYLFQPTAANLAAYEAATAATDRAEPAFIAAMNSQGTTGTENSAGAKAVSSLVSGLSQLPTLRNAVKARALSPLDALGAYSQGITTQLKLFLIQTESVTLNDQQIQAVGLIATVQAREQLSQEDALLSGMLAAQADHGEEPRSRSPTWPRPGRPTLAYADYILSPANLAIYNAALAGSGPMQQNLTGIEQAIAAGTPVAKLPVTQAQWQQLAGTLLQDEYNGGVAVANAILAADHQISHSAWVRVAVTSGIALLGLLITILFTRWSRGGIIRRLRGLERSARPWPRTSCRTSSPGCGAARTWTWRPRRRRCGSAATRSAGSARPSSWSGRPPSGPRWRSPGCGRASTTCSAAWPGAASRCCTAS